MVQIPLISGAQAFGITLGDNEYNIKTIFRDGVSGPAWYVDVERTDGSDAVLGIPLVLGADLFGQFQYKGFGHLTCTLDGSTNQTPAYDDMGRYITLTWSE